jgi:hypothetical protein
VSQYDRYREDSAVLAAVGMVLRDQTPAAVVLPEGLRQAVVAAWQRDETDHVAQQETVEQRALRERAGRLALIGLALEHAGGSGVVRLDPEDFAAAVAAASDGEVPLHHRP